MKITTVSHKIISINQKKRRLENTIVVRQKKKFILSYNEFLRSIIKFSWKQIHNFNKSKKDIYDLYNDIVINKFFKIELNNLVTLDLSVLSESNTISYVMTAKILNSILQEKLLKMLILETKNWKLIPEHILHRFTELTYLSIQNNNHLKIFPNELLKKQTKLEELCFAQNKFLTDIPPTLHLKRLKRLICVKNPNLIIDINKVKSLKLDHYYEEK